MTESEAFEHWIDTFDGGLVVTNRLIWAAAWKAATEAEREACAKKVRALAPPFEQTRHGTTDYERGVLDAVDAIAL